MPLYDFHCPSCDKTFELLIRHGAAAACPTCGNDHVERQISATAAPGKMKGIASAARAQAKREGHLSNF